MNITVEENHIWNEPCSRSKANVNSLSSNKEDLPALAITVEWQKTLGK